ncbi:MAG: ATP-binding protein [Actinobacteria bacterium]|nr:ATP-binding protein [Actinomycetota bacterium]
MPELSARPLLASALDAELFVDRESELAGLERSARARLNALVVGERGVGKTSLLHQLERRLEDDEELAPVFVEGARRAERPEELLSLLAYRLDADRARFSHLGEALQTVGRRPPRTPTESLLGGLGAIRDAIAQRERRPLLILDELPSGEVANVLFGQLRDELWSVPATWVVAAEAGEQAALLRPPASAFFETVISLPPLPDGEALELLRRRMADEQIPSALLLEVVAAGEGNPRRLVGIARDAVLEGRDVDDLAGAQAAVRDRARELGEAASRLVAYLEANGAASASDGRMLSELGWSRSRATQVLRELEQAGLVEPANDRGESGRRKVYALVGAR